MSLKVRELTARLRRVPPKAWIAVVLLVGFAATLPIWFSMTTEDRQRMVGVTAAKRIVERNVGTIDLAPEETRKLAEMVRKPTEVDQAEPDFERQVWVKDIAATIRPWVADEREAETIARWVYVYSVRFDLSPELVLAVIAVESQFDHFAVSNVGAVGLMQVMPFWKDKIGSPDDNLLDVETNIRYGCAIIRHYLDRYKRLDRALAAYNGSLNDRSMRYAGKVFAAMKRFKATRLDL
ncbi:MAG: lytic transglycosylase domain-containing protein [Mariprofundaceae bacterium]